MSSRDGEGEEYEAWMAQVPGAITSESTWKFYAYRKALYLYDLCWDNRWRISSSAAQDRSRPTSRKAMDAVGARTGSIFLRVALGSARESKGWYYRAKALMTPATLAQRLSLLGEIIALLVTELNRRRAQ